MSETSISTATRLRAASHTLVLTARPRVSVARQLQRDDRADSGQRGGCGDIRARLDSAAQVDARARELCVALHEAEP